MSDDSPTQKRKSARGRRLGFALLAFGLFAVVLVGVDRLAYRAWWSRTYIDGVGVAVEDDASLNKDFIRFVPHPVLGWTYHPNSTLRLDAANRFTGRTLPYTIATNDLALRSPPLRRPKSVDTVRIVAMGGSSTMGPGVALRRTYIMRLAELLRPRLAGREVEPVNAGVDGYNALQGFLLYREVIRGLKPDLVVVAYDVNNGYLPMTAAELAAAEPDGADMPDPQDPYLELDLRHEEQRWLIYTINPWLYESGLFYTVTYLSRWLRHRLADTRPAILVPEPAAGSYPRRCRTPHALAAVAVDGSSGVAIYRHCMEALAKDLRADKVPMIVLSVPVTAPDIPDMNAPHPYVAVQKGLCSDHGSCVHVNPIERFCQHPMGDVMIDGVHMAERGHAIVAEALAPHAEKLLSTP